MVSRIVTVVRAKLENLVRITDVHNTPTSALMGIAFLREQDAMVKVIIPIIQTRPIVLDHQQRLHQMWTIGNLNGILKHL